VVVFAPELCVAIGAFPAGVIARDATPSEDYPAACDVGLEPVIEYRISVHNPGNPVSATFAAGFGLLLAPPGLGLFVGHEESLPG
jgi:hypothetical protein